MQQRERRILNYWLVEELGHDRLGQVFRAEESRADRTVVLRLLRVAGVVPEARVAAARDALRRRIRLAAAIAHPSLAPILDLTAWEDVEVLAVEDVRGPTLLELGARQSLPPLDEVLWHATEIATGLEAAHARGVPHGRISPANVRMARDGRVRLLDLGIPRPTEVAYHIGGSDGDGTDTGMRRDVHALARTIQFMVTGDAEAARRDAARIPGLGGAIVRTVSDAIDAPDPDVGRLREALVDLARHTPADAVAPARPAPRARTPRSRPDPVRAPVPLPEPVAALVPFPEPEPERDGSANVPEEEAAKQVLVPEHRRHRRSRSSRLVLALERARTLAGTRITQIRSPAVLRFAGSALAGALLVLVAIAFVRRSTDGTSAQAPAEAAAEMAVEASPAGDEPAAPAPRGEPAPAPATPPAAPPPAPPPETPDFGALRVSVSPGGALVSLDGGPWRPAPVSFIDLAAGLHRVRIQRSGFAIRSDTVTVRPGQTTRRTYELEGRP